MGQAAGAASPEADDGLDPNETTEDRRETFAEHLTRLADAISEAEPYRAAADALALAWKHGREARHLEKIQGRAGGYRWPPNAPQDTGRAGRCAGAARVETLSEDIGAILKRIHLTEHLAFKGAKLQRKAGLKVHAGFAEDLKIDATLVANTSWLRAVLWAFLFALRQEAVKQLGADPWPAVLDDPQATFDAEHRHRWALEIVGLQTRSTPAQVILAARAEVFVELLKIDGVKGREAIIVSAGPELGHVGIFEGASLDRKWKKSTEHGGDRTGLHQRRPASAQGLLRLMLRGHAADVNWATPASLWAQPATRFANSIWPGFRPGTKLNLTR